jgi:hypothetical protein
MQIRRSVPLLAIGLVVLAAPARAGFTERVSVGVGGVQGNGATSIPFSRSPA